MSRRDTRTVLIVGSESCGKTSYFKAIYRKLYRQEFNFTECDHHFAVNLDGINLPVRIIDGNPAEDQKNEFYLCANAIILIFGLDDRESLLDIKRKWFPEVITCAPDGTPVFIVGNKRDLRDEGKSNDLVLHCEGLAVASKLGVSYAECSAETGEEVLNVLKVAAKAAFRKSKSTSSTRCVTS